MKKTNGFEIQSLNSVCLLIKVKCFKTPDTGNSYVIHNITNNYDLYLICEGGKSELRFQK